MNKQVSPIPQPNLGDARQLTALELNAMTYDVRHTVLTPEILAAHRATDNRNVSEQGAESSD